MDSAESSEFKISEAQPSDLDAALDIRLEARRTDEQYFANSYEDELQRPRERREQWFKQFSENRNFMVLEKAGSKAVGILGAIEQEPGIWDIRSVYVRPEARKQHIADNMVRYAIEKIVSYNDARAITLKAVEANVGALKLYEKFGFKIIETGIREVHGDGRTHDKVLMRLMIQHSQ